MPVIKLTYNDINEMVQQAVRSVLNESVKEVQGSIMAGKEDIVQEILDYIKNQWELKKENGEAPVSQGKYTYDDGKTVFTGRQDDYIILIPASLTKKLGIAESFDINIAVNDFEVPEDKLQYFDGLMRGSEGTSYGGPEYSQYIRSEKMVTKGRIDIYVPSINGELQTQGLASTMYHELNHGASRLSLQTKHEDLPDDELNKMGFFSATRRAGNDNPHYVTSYEMSDQNDNPLAQLFGMFVSPQDKEVKEWKKKISSVFYAIWETTERNARAEGLYGELTVLKPTRENFREVWQKTQLCQQIKGLNELINEFEQIPTDPLSYLSRVWHYAAGVMNMKRRGKNISPRTNATRRYYDAIKERFLSRSREYLDILYKKAMKVAELYFQRREPEKQPGRLQQYKDAKKAREEWERAQEERRKAQNLLRAIFGK